MKKLYAHLGFLLFTSLALAQQYGNEWINYGQKYYKFPIIQDGVYRIDSAALANSGINVSSIDPRRFQVFGRGQELAIYVQGEGDSVFNSSDYIEFYAQHNDGWLDSLVYQDTVEVVNPYYSLYTDTAVYFLTWNNSTNNLRMQWIQDTAFSAFTPVNYFFKEEVVFRPYQYQFGNTTSIGTTESHYSASEGWTDNRFPLGSSGTPFTLTTANSYAGGPPAKLWFAAVGASNDFTITPDHHLQVEYRDISSPVYRMALDTVFEAYAYIPKTKYIPVDSLGPIQTEVRFKSVIDVGFSSNYTAACYVGIKFPHTFNLENQSRYTLYLPDNTSQSKSYLKITNFNATAPIYLYDITNGKRFTVYSNGTTDSVLVPNSGGEKTCYITSESQITPISSLTPVSATASFSNFPAVTFDSAFLIVTHPTLWNEAQNYGGYRSSVNGGDFNVVIVNVEELYDQFAYGVKKNPLAIRNFCRLAYDTSGSVPPQHLFIIGKAVEAQRCRNSNQFGPYITNYNNNLVPAWGYPPTDNLITAGLNGTWLEPLIPTGRLATIAPADVDNYLAKVMDYEDNPNEEWMKHILHFAGGTDAGQVAYHSSCLGMYEYYLESPYFGGYVSTFKKFSSQPIQITISDSVTQRINNGASIMTFFGHSSATGFDQTLDSPGSYDNNGKYPLIVANGCLIGNIHRPLSFGLSGSESWVLTPNKGAIGFIGTIDQSVGASLCVYSDKFFQHLAYSSYGKSVGHCMKQAVLLSQDTLDVYINQVCMEMSLHGDPALVINSFPYPDYAITDSSVYYTPAIVSTALDSFDVSVVVTNTGKATSDTVGVELKRIFPGGASVVYNKIMTGVYYRDTVTFTLPVDKIFGPGLNKFEVMVDPTGAIAEMSELNNNVVVPPSTLFIYSGDIIPVYPYKYAIVPDDTVRLKASTGNPFAPAVNYRFEVDTNDMFLAPIAFTVINAPGGVVTWNLPLTLTDSTVYYWRVRRDDPDTVNFKWKESSFQYIAGKRGWEQAHFFQFKDDDLNYLNYNRPGRSFDFVPSGKTLICNNYGQDPSQYNSAKGSATNFLLDLTQVEYNGCTTIPSMHVAVIDPITLTAWGKRWIDNSTVPPTVYNPTHVFGNANDLSSCRNRVEYYFIFRHNDANQLNGMRTMLQDSVPDGHYILVYSWLKPMFSQWASPSVLTFMRDSLGADSITALPDTVPYILFCKKGDLNSAIELWGDSVDAFIQLQATMTNSADFGTITSELIGPAMSWDSLSWRQLALEYPSADSTRLNVIGVSASGIETQLMSLPADSSEVYLNSIDPATYPYLKLNAYIADDSLQTAPQLRKWQVFYQPAPEIAVNPPLFFSYYADTVQEGDSIRFQVAVQNISEFFMDSTLVTFWIIDNNRAIHPLPSYMANPLSPDSFLIASAVVSSRGYPGLNSLWMEINPLNTARTQYEQYHFNNITQIGFFAGVDRINPLLDVTFDGVHILNGDIVSARPNILIQLKDENMFLALNDTSDFAVFLKKPSQTLAQRVYFGPEMIFTPAVLPDNSCKINFMPVLPEDGIYELIVQAKDQSGNLSGSIDYKITFEVQNKPTITEVLNYPNPFSTSTRFVFTLTGSEVPTYMKIQIFTVTGKLVREIDKDELGNIHIGRNITDYAWDGKDEFGDQLANGVYFYRVLTELNGSAIEKNQTTADQYFTKGFGKMYLMR
ncbi:MAG: C25 family cysteine peptidase [Bacteroidota bacterium]